MPIGVRPASGHLKPDPTSFFASFTFGEGLAQGIARHQYINVRVARLAGHVETLSAIADETTVDEVIIKLRSLGEHEVDAWIPL